MKEWLLNLLASWVIKLLTIDSVRVFVFTRVLRKIDIDDLIRAVRTSEDKKEKK